MDAAWFGKNKTKTTFNGAGESMSRLFLKVSAYNALFQGILHLVFSVPYILSSEYDRMPPLWIGQSEPRTLKSQEWGTSLVLLFGISPIVYAVVALAISYGWHPTNEDGRIRFRFVAEILLFLSPIILVGNLDETYTRPCILWSFTSPILRCSFSGSKDILWIMWMVFYAVAVVIFHVLLSSLSSGVVDESLSRGWLYLLYFLNHMLPLSLVIVPLSFTSWQLSADESQDQKLLQDSLATMKQETRLLEALVPQTIAKRLRQGESNIANGYESVTVIFVYILDYSDTAGS